MDYLSTIPTTYNPSNEYKYGLDDLMKVGAEIDRLSDAELDELRQRWDEWIILFPATKKSSGEGDILMPILRHVVDFDPRRGVSMSWKWCWVSIDKYEYESRARSLKYGTTLKPFEDCNNVGYPFLKTPSRRLFS